MIAAINSHNAPDKNRMIVEHALAHLDHLLPAQAPILDFVHHNTLHGFQHLPFEQALAAYQAVTGVTAYLPESSFRELFRAGRITKADLHAVFAQRADLNLQEVIYSKDDRVITRGDIYAIAMQHDISAITLSGLNWQIEEMRALTSVQPDVPNEERLELLDSANEEVVIRQLWSSLLTRLDMQQAALHPEDLLDLSLEQVENWLSVELPSKSEEPAIHAHMLAYASTELDVFFQQLGNDFTLRGLVLALTGTDILDSVRPQLLKICGSGLDEGVAAWQLPGRSDRGLYAIWRDMAQYDANLFLIDFRDQQGIISIAPEDPVDAIILHLIQLAIPEQSWPAYLEKLALELPGWAGMVNWRQQHPDYRTENKANVTLADFLAIRLTLDALWFHQLCRETWKVEANVTSLQGYFRKNLSEFLVRKTLYQGKLPEYLTTQAFALTESIGSERSNREEWQRLADLFWTWQFSPMSPQQAGHCVFDSGWRLFRLCQHLGINARWIHPMHKEDLLHMLAILDECQPGIRNPLWLAAYEHHYREELFQALWANRGRGRWAQRTQRPGSQIIFCMDDREESFRRHLEEHNPAIETFGAAGFFGVAMNYKGMDDSHAKALCPIVVKPVHQVYEKPQANQEKALSHYHNLQRWRLMLENRGYQGLRRYLLLAQPLLHVAAPIRLFSLMGLSIFPQVTEKLSGKLFNKLTPRIATQLIFTTPPGFSDDEQADRVAAFLRNIGLTDEFSPLVVLMGHGSTSENNPHDAAHNCGACSGHHGGPNARVFAAMANRSEVRRLLLDRHHIDIPQDVWFIGAEHNTCSEAVTWFDTDQIPDGHLRIFSKLQNEINHARRMSAHERCRRLASAPDNPTPERALTHIEERSLDYSQSRPELGHATNAAAVIGRRSVTQGAFFDRRVFLISYDPTQDHDGTLLEGILLAVGPVGAGINLEYYFSTVDNERFGCGSKTPHNLTGFFGIMDGANSDLRTGLPLQMVEVHEAMRLQLVVEAKTEVLAAIHARQPALRELIDGRWLHVTALDPETGALSLFQPDKGFVPWIPDDTALPCYENSPACYRGQTGPVSPVLIKQPDLQAS